MASTIKRQDQLGFVGWRLAVLTPLVTAGVVGLLAFLLSALAAACGLPPLEWAWAFVWDATLSVIAPVLWLELIALLLILAGFIGHWCFSLTTDRSASFTKGARLAPQLSESGKFRGSILGIRLATLGSPLWPYIHNRASASTPAGLSGAEPLLE